MTAEQVIHEIESLPAEDQARLIRFAYRLDAERQLTGAELSSLAARMARSTDPAEAMMLREEIVRGFYGGEANSESTHLPSPFRLEPKRSGVTLLPV
jgi:hypothetical protein